jgi:tRNA pseudouridine55 synthase
MGRRRRSQGRNDDLLQGVLLVDKPAGLTSHEVCQRVKAKLRLGKVGHGGTLDPFATGLLPLLLNGATRLMPQLQGATKEYEAVVRLGTRTDTMDPTGEVIETGDHSGVTKADIAAQLPQFTGRITQTIPRYSAARVDGKRLYEYAREGLEVELPTKEVEITEIALLNFTVTDDYTDFGLRVSCSTGTYIRALADDLGQALGCPAHLFSLRRTRTGTFSMESGIALDTVVDQSEAWKEARLARQEDEGIVLRFEPLDNARRWSEFLGAALVPVSELLGGVPTLRLPEELVQRIQSGQPLRKGDLGRLDPEGRLSFDPGDQLVLEDGEGLRGVAVVRAKCSSESLKRRDSGDIVLDVERVLR